MVTPVYTHRQQAHLLPLIPASSASAQTVGTSQPLPCRFWADQAPTGPRHLPSLSHAQTWMAGRILSLRKTHWGPSATFDPNPNSGSQTQPKAQPKVQPKAWGCCFLPEEELQQHLRETFSPTTLLGGGGGAVQEPCRSGHLARGRARDLRALRGLGYRGASPWLTQFTL